MIYITGDMHRDFKRLNNMKFNQDDMLIILGDVGINFLLDERDKELKKYLGKYNIKFFCVRGNHEERPENIKTYHEKDMFGGKVFIEDEYPYLIFAKDGEVYDIDGKKILVIGGAYSIDKEYRKMFGYAWFKDEQLNEEEMNNIFEKVKGNHYDIVLTHTCPFHYEPVETYLPGIDQSKVDESMEHFLFKVEKNIDYDKWYCGHYHIEKQVDKMEFMFQNIKKFYIYDKENEDKKFIKNNK